MQFVGFCGIIYNMETMHISRTKPGETVTISRAEYEKLARENAELKAYISELESKLNWFMEQFRLSQNRRFGASSEAASEEVMEQLSFLFNEAEYHADETEAEETAKEETVVVRSHERKKKRSGSVRDVVPENIEVEEVRHELPEEERVCPKCGTVMEPIGTKVVETLELIPARAVLHRDVYVNYACQNCKVNDIEVPIVETPRKSSLIPGGFASAKAAAHIITQKFLMYVPLYRQEQEWKRQGLLLSRQTMSEWVLAGAEILTPLYDELHRLLLSSEILHADETVLQVLHEKGKTAQSKSYMWLYMTGAAEERQIVLYEYQPGRSGNYPAAFLQDFHGYLQTDGYDGYNSVEDVTRLGCWAHMRRKFDEAVKALPKGKRVGAAVTGQAYCTKLFLIERELQDLPPETRYKNRLRREKPLLDEFRTWADTRTAAPKSKLGQAFSYLQNQWTPLTNYLLDGRLEISNNRAERSIKPFVMGRKNFLFANTPRGARASTVLYSILETAKTNALDPYRYLLFLLEDFPNANQERCDWFLPFLPWNAPDDCHINHRKSD